MFRKSFLLASLLIVGCSSDSGSSNGTDPGNNTDPSNDADVNGASGPVSDAPLALMTTTGQQILADSLRCIYRQSMGSDTTLSLQLQYLRSPGEVAFALYLDDPIPAAPFRLSAGQQGVFTFEAFSENVGYQDELSNGEVEIELSNLPSPSTLTDGELVSLEGTLIVNPFPLTERSATGQQGNQVLSLASSQVDIDTECLYQLALVLD